MVKPRILKNVSFVAFFLVFTFILSCNETYWPKINASDERLVVVDGVFNVRQPFQVEGNISNRNNPNETVLGYFFAGGLEERRVFFDRPPLSVPFYYSNCELTQRDFEAYNDLWMADPGYWPIYITTSPDGTRAVPHRSCIDCRKSGGEIKKPDFWIDD
ncbi:MAG: hypothetical protein KQH67_09070 [Bacteroidetes bacterium]|nr:hypothetical protein [Bacteroidota bacterium]